MDDQFRAVYNIVRPDRKLLTLYLLRCLLTGPGFFILILPAFFKYETLRYRFDEDGITMSWGILWRREIFLTYARIQDIHLSRGLLERWLGLGTIHIQTAAGSSGSEMAVVGLIEHDVVRDFLYLQMRGARFGDRAAEERAAATDAAEPETGADDDEIVGLLTEIRDGVRAVAQRLEGDGRDL